MKEKTNIISARVSPDISELIKLKAAQQNCNKNFIIKEALTLYLKQDIDSVSLIQAALQNIRKDVSFMENQMELLSRLFMFWLPYFFATSPELPQTDERKAMIEKAKTRAASMLEQFKKDFNNTTVDNYFKEELLWKKKQI
jgi:hypothetical protein